MAGDGSTRLRVRVPAKINLHLAVGPRRPDGYHDLVSVLQTVSLHDTLRIRCDDGQALHPAARRRMGLVLTADGTTGDAVPLDDDNLVLVAGRRLMREVGMGVEPGDGGPTPRLPLTKRIPVPGLRPRASTAADLPSSRTPAGCRGRPDGARWGVV